MGKASQRKGRRGEAELAKILRERGYNVEPGQAVSFGSEPDLVGLDNIHIECKRNERLNIMEAMKQSIADSEKFRDGVPVVCHRKNRHGWLVTMRLDDWLTMYRKGANNEQH